MYFCWESNSGVLEEHPVVLLLSLVSFLLPCRNICQVLGLLSVLLGAFFRKSLLVPSSSASHIFPSNSFKFWSLYLRSLSILKWFLCWKRERHQVSIVCLAPLVFLGYHAVSVTVARYCKLIVGISIFPALLFCLELFLYFHMILGLPFLVLWRMKLKFWWYLCSKGLFWYSW